MQVRKESSNNQKKADGFLNVVLVDANGHRHNFKMGIPLYSERKIDGVLLNDPKMVDRLTIDNIELVVNPLTEAVDPVF